jgi:activator of HSP90 ATPase
VITKKLKAMATIIQKELFKNTTREALYDLYMNPKKHSMIIDGPVEISDKAYSSFKAFGGYITGKNLELVKNQLIVQLWRGSDWDSNEPDSVFLISLEQKGKDVMLNMIHANVPEDKEKSLDKGWYEHYWNPWKQHLAGQPVTRPKM